MGNFNKYPKQPEVKNALWIFPLFYIVICTQVMYVHLLIEHNLDTTKYIIWIDCIMLPIFKFFYILRKTWKSGKIHWFLLKNWVSLFIPAQLLFFFSLKNIICYCIWDVLIKSNLFLAVYIIFSVLIFHIFTRIPQLKLRNFELPYLCKTLSYSINF